MIETIKVSSRGQIVIPESFRNSLGIEEGTRLILIEKGDNLILKKEVDFIEEFEKNELEKEKMGWLSLAEKGVEKIWDNAKDEEVWKKHL